MALDADLLAGFCNLCHIFRGQRISVFRRQERGLLLMRVSIFQSTLTADGKWGWRISDICRVVIMPWCSPPAHEMDTYLRRCSGEVWPMVASHSLFLISWVQVKSYSLWFCQFYESYTLPNLFMTKIIFHLCVPSSLKKQVRFCACNHPLDSSWLYTEFINRELKMRLE